MKRVFVAGHRGMVGSAIVRQLTQVAGVEVITRTRLELDLLDGAAVKRFFEAENIDQVYLAAAKVGGIIANNTYPAEFIYENLAIQNNIIHGAHLADVNDLLFWGQAVSILSLHNSQWANPRCSLAYWSQQMSPTP